MTKKRGVRISKNLFDSLSTVFCHSLHVQVFPIFPRKMQPRFQSDRKQKNSIHKTKMYLQQKKWETKQLVKETQSKSNSEWKNTLFAHLAKRLYNNSNGNNQRIIIHKRLPLHNKLYGYLVVRRLSRSLRFVSLNLLGLTIRGTELPSYTLTIRGTELPSYTWTIRGTELPSYTLTIRGTELPSYTLTIGGTKLPSRLGSTIRGPMLPSRMLINNWLFGRFCFKLKPFFQGFVLLEFPPGGPCVGQLDLGTSHLITIFCDVFSR